MSRPKTPPVPPRHAARKRKKWRPDSAPPPSSAEVEPSAETTAETSAEVAASSLSAASKRGSPKRRPTKRRGLKYSRDTEPVASVPHAKRRSVPRAKPVPQAKRSKPQRARKTKQRRQKAQRGQQPRQSLSLRRWREQRTEAEQRELWLALKRGRATVPDTPTARAGAQVRARALLQPTPVRWVWVLLPLLLLAGAASRLALPIREVAVSGHARLSAEQVARAAGVSGPDTSWLYYGARQAQGLAGEPWVAAATVTRQFPDRLHIAVTERTPYAVWRRTGGDVLVARDGTPLTTEAVQDAGAAQDTPLPAVEGWGPNRLPEALALLETLRPYHVQLVKFTPSGFTVYTAEGGAAWSGDLATLLKHADALAQYPNKPLYIYPWGVSVQE